MKYKRLISFYLILFLCLGCLPINNFTVHADVTGEYLNIIKEDYDTKEKLLGAVFEVTSKDLITNNETTFEITDEDFTEFPLAIDNLKDYSTEMYIREKVAPNGYEINNKTYKLIANNSSLYIENSDEYCYLSNELDQGYELHFRNKAITSKKIIKKWNDGLTGEAVNKRPIPQINITTTKPTRRTSIMSRFKNILNIIDTHAETGDITSDGYTEYTENSSSFKFKEVGSYLNIKPLNGENGIINVNSQRTVWGIDYSVLPYFYPLIYNYGIDVEGNIKIVGNATSLFSSRPDMDGLGYEKDLTNLSKIDVSGMTKCDYLFEYTRIKNNDLLSIKDWDVSNVEDFSKIFEGCQMENAVIDISNWNTNGKAVTIPIYCYASYSNYTNKASYTFKVRKICVSDKNKVKFSGYPDRYAFWKNVSTGECLSTPKLEEKINSGKGAGEWEAISTIANFAIYDSITKELLIYEKDYIDNFYIKDEQSFISFEILNIINWKDYDIKKIKVEVPLTLSNSSELTGMLRNNTATEYDLTNLNTDNIRSISTFSAKKVIVSNSFKAALSTPEDKAWQNEEKNLLFYSSDFLDNLDKDLGGVWKLIDYPRIRLRPTVSTDGKYVKAGDEATVSLTLKGVEKEVKDVELVLLGDEEMVVSEIISITGNTERVIKYEIRDSGSATTYLSELKPSDEITVNIKVLIKEKDPRYSYHYKSYCYAEGKNTFNDSGDPLYVAFSFREDSPCAIYNATNKSLYFYNTSNVQKESDETMYSLSGLLDNTYNSYYNIPWRSKSIKSVKFIDEGIAPKSISYWFELPELEEIDLAKLDTSRLKDVTRLCSTCKNLKKLDLSNIEVSGNYMFPSSLEEIKLNPNFSFLNKNNTINSLLPRPANTQLYSGKWKLLNTDIAYYPEDLAFKYNEDLSGTWVLEYKQTELLEDKKTDDNNWKIIDDNTWEYDIDIDVSSNTYYIYEDSIEGYTSDSDINNFKILNKNVNEVIITNTRVFNINVDKKVEGAGGDKNTEFNFDARVWEENSTTNAVNYLDLSSFGGMDNEDGSYTFKLKDNQGFILENMPYGYKYEIVERDYSSEGYITTADGNNTREVNGVLTEDKIHKFSNTRNLVIPVGVNNRYNISYFIVIIMISFFMIYLSRKVKNNKQ